ncbi:protein kinase domain-containing protein [Nocardia blacklockiae]|uniref:protein kinase domain-containing protein n=1 Tax=Nocardia blacklockiae TaxID=480036 RepID=UPI0018943571|nr:protein kinase [Nocardia blacklockiae]MBF6172528.1 protein kinase [Nocardia blacklockiae]
MFGPGDVFAGYVIERQLGRGGMGSVYLARHPRLPRFTALKLLNRELVADNEIRARFEREADLAARLDHPNIVTVFDRGIEAGQLWISMQYVEGIDGSSIAPATLPPAEAIRIVGETAMALDHAHSLGVLHRDVKPANILLGSDPIGENRVYLTDFGIARLRDDTTHLTRTGTFTATLAYASPEQLSSSPMDHRADQYSLACTLFWLLTGTPPYSAPSAAAVIQGHLMAPPPLVSTTRPGLNPALDHVLRRAMAKRPADRYHSCSEFAAAAAMAIGAARPAADVLPVARAHAPTSTPPPIEDEPKVASPQPFPDRRPQRNMGRRSAIAFTLGVVIAAALVATTVAALNRSPADPEIAAPSTTDAPSTPNPAPQPTLVDSYLQPPHQKQYGRPDVVYDPCTWIPDDVITRAGYDFASRNRDGDQIAETTHLGCRFKSKPRTLTIRSRNETWDEDLKQVGAWSEPVRVNGREAMWVRDPGGADTCSIHLRTKVGYVDINSFVTLYGLARDVQPCDGLLDTASILEPTIGTNN